MKFYISSRLITQQSSCFKLIENVSSFRSMSGNRSEARSFKHIFSKENFSFWVEGCHGQKITRYEKFDWHCFRFLKSILHCNIYQHVLFQSTFNVDKITSWTPRIHKLYSASIKTKIFAVHRYVDKMTRNIIWR